MFYKKEEGLHLLEAQQPRKGRQLLRWLIGFTYRSFKTEYQTQPRTKLLRCKILGNACRRSASHFFDHAFKSWLLIIGKTRVQLQIPKIFLPHLKIQLCEHKKSHLDHCMNQKL